jgi:hypothetical protein
MPGKQERTIQITGEILLHFPHLGITPLQLNTRIIEDIPSTKNIKVCSFTVSNASIRFFLRHTRHVSSRFTFLEKSVRL